MLAQLDREGVMGSAAPGCSDGREHPSACLGGHPRASPSCALHADSGPLLHLIVRNVFWGIKEQVQSPGESLVQTFCLPSVRILPLSTPGQGGCPVWSGTAGFEHTWHSGMNPVWTSCSVLL